MVIAFDDTSISENTSQRSTASFDVDYDCNPTVLYKLIESKQWKAVVSRLKSHPEEAAAWVTRRKKDGNVRWKLLPLHAVLCLKAKSEIVLAVLDAFPHAASFVDDQGKLPLHTAIKNIEIIDEEVIKALIEANPHGMLTRDSRGRIPLQMRGVSLMVLVEYMMGSERKKIRSEQKTFFETKMDSERLVSAKYIKGLEDEFRKLTKFREVQDEELKEMSFKFEELEKIVKEQQSMVIPKKVRDLEQQLDAKDEQIEREIFQMNQQEANVLKQREICDKQETEIERLNDTVAMLKAQLDAQEIDLKRKKAEVLQISKDVKNYDSENTKLSDACAAYKGNIDILENKIASLNKTLDSQNTSFSKTTYTVQDAVKGFSELAVGHDKSLETLLKYEEIMEHHNTRRENLIKDILDNEEKIFDIEAEERKNVMDSILQQRKLVESFQSKFSELSLPEIKKPLPESRIRSVVSKKKTLSSRH